MSCIHCLNKNKGIVDPYPCVCDEFVHPLPLHIDAGLNKLPRQIGTFHEFRRAMLRLIRKEKVQIIDTNNALVTIAPLVDWRARDKDDLGIMLLEMWAYVSDSLSFYDEVLANEAYLRTSYLRPSLRRLVDLLGYLPRPAVGSIIELAAIADGRLQIKLPAGTAFRSTAFNGNPPQVFELDDPQFIHPFTNSFGIEAPHRGTISTANPQALLVDTLGEIKEDMVLLLLHKNSNSQTGAVKVRKLEKYTGADTNEYDKLRFTAPTNLHAGASLSKLRLLGPTLKAGLWSIGEINESIKGDRITLNVLSHEIKPGDPVVLSYGEERRWFKVEQVIEVTRSSIPAGTITVNGNVFNVPGVAVSVTLLRLDTHVNSIARKPAFAADWTPEMCAGIIVHFGMQPIATVIDEPNTKLVATDPLSINTTIEIPIENHTSTRFLLRDKNTIGVSVGGDLLYDEREITIDAVNDWKEPLTLPVEAYGNVIRASRGEKVESEKMGSGNASIPSQTFKLKKKPLTYQLSPTVENDQGVKSTLTVYINGIRWTEVNTFFGRTANDQVYIVRQNDEGESWVTFGDGIRGQRLPTGSDNIICSYRFGAEAACPPAGSVSQIAKPVKGLQSVKNMLPAFGGADPEKEESLRKNAPRSALVLGRVVSMKDMEALTNSFPGVRGVQTEWRWDNMKQRASAHIYYIGDPGLRAMISKRLRSYSDPSTPITVELAQPVPLVLSLDVKIDPRYMHDDVMRELRRVLAEVPDGFLAPEKIGIGSPLFRSKVFEQVLNVKGTQSVKAIHAGTSPFTGYAITPGIGHYFDIEQGDLILNVIES